MDELYRSYLSFLRSMSRGLESLTGLNEKKLTAAQQEDLMGLNDLLNQEQAQALNFRGLELTRDKLLPQLGLEGVPQSEQGRAMDIFKQMVFYGAQGAAFTRNTRLHISEHTACMLHPELAGEMDDPDYNNEHYQMAWADCKFEDV